MNGNGTLSVEDIDESDDESLRTRESDDESEGIFDILDPLGLRQIFSGPSRPPLPMVPPFSGSGGVDRATLATPRGTATLQLPQPVVSRDEFNQATQRLQEAINRDTARTNTIQNDLRSLTQRVGAAASESKRDISRVRRDVVQIRRENAAAITKLRRDQSQQNTTNMMISFMMQRQIQDQISTHTHNVGLVHHHPLVGGAAATGNEAALPDSSQSATVATGAGGGASSNMLFMLPFLMSGSQDGGGGGDNMMMMAMMFAFM
jgi:hypothetical protein